jgi:hypothetical protein
LDSVVAPFAGGFEADVGGFCEAAGLSSAALPAVAFGFVPFFELWELGRKDRASFER